MIPHDYHVHSNYSADAHATMEEMCRSAISRGIPEIGFAEHYDLHPDEKPRDWLRLDPWLSDLERCRALFEGDLTIRAGIEIGEPHLFASELRSMLARAPFDYAIGSLHWVGRSGVFDAAFYQRPADEAFRLYFEELERMTRSCECDILGHFDVPVRTAYDTYGCYDPRRYESLIRRVLRNCVERGIVLEINSSALRRAANILLPGSDILTWYVEMGGDLVTLGSDAHRPDQLAAHLDIALMTAKAAGIRHIAQFCRRNPRAAVISCL